MVQLLTDALTQEDRVAGEKRGGRTEKGEAGVVSRCAGTPKKPVVRERSTEKSMLSVPSSAQ